MLPIAQVLGRHFSAASSKPKLAHSTSSAAAFAVAQFEHRLSSQPSPMVSLAMTVPAGTKYSVDTKDSGTVAAYYKHSILQGTKNESRIALARKADLRPSPIEITQSRDLLCLSAHFHVNYLPDLMETFAQLVPSRKELEIENAIVQGPVRDAALLDASIAKQDVRGQIAEAAWMTAFRGNHLYARDDAYVSPQQLADFHSAVLRRKEGFSLLLGVNESSIITAGQFEDVVKASGLERRLSSTKAVFSPGKANVYYFGGEARIEDASPDASNYALIAFSLQDAGVSEANFALNWLAQSFLQAVNPSPKVAPQNVFSAVTADTSLHGLFFQSPGDDLKAQITHFLSTVKGFNFADEAVFKALKNRAMQNYTLSLDSRNNRVLSFAHQLGLRGHVLSEAEMRMAIDSVTADQFAALVSEALNKPTLVTRGALKELPVLADLRV